MSPERAIVRGVVVVLLATGAGAVVALAASEPAITDRPFAARSGPQGATLFVELTPEQTGIVTENRYEDPAMWAQRYAEFATGAVGTGVTIGDYDRDGRPDLFVVSKTETCRLFRNLGDWKFTDVTTSAGVGESAADALIWKQGATFVDVDNDGWLDLYLCRFEAPNRLWINQRNGTFREEAGTRGLDLSDGSVMAAFCDYDRDGWLDVFVQTNRPDSTTQQYPQRNHLYRNEGGGFFADVTAAAGISGRAQGHAAIWWDADGEGGPDLYVANDFNPPDKLYRNNGDGTFTDAIHDLVPCMPFSSMGVDLGDVNNDGRIDLFVADMAATTREKDQRTMANARGLLREHPVGAATAPSVMRNVLYLNSGDGRFLEAARLAGLAATDWTWSVRLEDLDNDGWLDVHVTNGMYREPHNADLMERIAAATSPLEKIRIERASPVLHERNLAYRNRGDLHFEDVSAEWGLDENGVSFGAAFGDLDDDGDLDLVYTNYRQGVTVLRNDAAAGLRIVVELQGTRSNRDGIGATVELETASGRQVRSLVLARGVLSSSEPVLHFGLGAAERVLRLRVTWPDGGMQEFHDLPVDRRYRIVEPATPPAGAGADRKQVPAQRQFSEVAAEANLSWLSRAAISEEALRQPLAPLRLNACGPALAIGDVNGDDRDDVVIGGTPLDPRRVLLAAEDGRFRLADSSWADGGSPLSDGPLLLFDANGDGANDLLVTKAGVGLPANATAYQPQLLLHDRELGFQPAAAGTLPPLAWSVGAVAAADCDRDGRLDLFIGARVTPGRYPTSPGGALLLNRGEAFGDATDDIAPGLRTLGMVTAALWSDVDNDGWLDLIVAEEWGGVRCWRSIPIAPNGRVGTMAGSRRFEEVSLSAGLASVGTGWWTALAAADFNGDGQMDYVLGNAGMNTGYAASEDRPALLFAGDFGGPDGWDLIEASVEDGRLYPRRSRRELGAALPGVFKRFPRNDRFARATLEELFSTQQLAAASRSTATELRSGVWLSSAKGGRAFVPLPRLAQIAPLQGIVTGDFDGDGHADIYAVQNSFGRIASEGRFDGGLSQFLSGDGRGNFRAVPGADTGLIVPGDAEALATLDRDHDGWADFVVSRHDATSLTFQNRARAGHHGLAVRLHGRLGNATAVGARITLQWADGATVTQEVHAGSGYLSQSSGDIFFGWSADNGPQRLTLRWPSGDVEEVVAVVPGRMSFRQP